MIAISFVTIILISWRRDISYIFQSETRDMAIERIYFYSIHLTTDRASVCQDAFREFGRKLPRSRPRGHAKLNLSFCSIMYRRYNAARCDFFESGLSLSLSLGVSLDARGVAHSVQPGVRRGGFRAWNRLKAAPRRCNAGVTNYLRHTAYCLLPVYTSRGGPTCSPDRWSINRIWRDRGLGSRDRGARAERGVVRISSQNSGRYDSLL